MSAFKVLLMDNQSNTSLASQLWRKRIIVFLSAIISYSMLASQLWRKNKYMYSHIHLMQIATILVFSATIFLSNSYHFTELCKQKSLTL